MPWTRTGLPSAPQPAAGFLDPQHRGTWLGTQHIPILYDTPSPRSAPTTFQRVRPIARSGFDQFRKFGRSKATRPGMSGKPRRGGRVHANFVASQGPRQRPPDPRQAMMPEACGGGLDVKVASFSGLGLRASSLRMLMLLAADPKQKLLNNSKKTGADSSKSRIRTAASSAACRLSIT